MMMTEDQYFIALEQTREQFSADGDEDGFRAALRRLGLTPREIDGEVAEAR